MLRKLLVMLDASPCSQPVTQFAIDLADRFKARLIGVAIIDIPAIIGPEAVSIGGMSYRELRDEKIVGDAKERGNRVLQEFAAKCDARQIEYDLIEELGEPSLQTALEAQRTDLIVLGRHLHFENEKYPNRILRNILKDSPRPVITVPEKPADGRGMLIAYDASMQAARMLQMFALLGLAGGQDVHVLSISDDSMLSADWADRAATFLQSHQINAHVQPLVSSQSPAKLLLQQVAKLNPQIVAMGAYGKPFIREFLLGSVSKTMLAECDRPMFVYH